MKRIVLIVVLSLMLVGCKPEDSYNVEPSGSGTHSRYYDDPEVNHKLSSILYDHWDLPAQMNVYSFVDWENNNICYVMDGYENGGISCLSLGGK